VDRNNIHRLSGAFNMRSYLSYVVCLLLAVPAFAEQQVNTEIGRKAGVGRNCDASEQSWCNMGNGTCSPEMRGRCGKRRGDWYGARQPVSNAAEAQKLLINYFNVQGYTVSEMSEHKWGFRAVIVDKDGKTVDLVMIDKRSGRIRSIN
jgi:hypothetical protein